MVKLTRSKSVSDKKSITPQKKSAVASIVSHKPRMKVSAKTLPKSKKPKTSKTFIPIQKEVKPVKSHAVGIVDKTKKESIPTTIETPHVELPLAIPSPLRFPLLPEKHIGMVSKLAGVSLILSGLLLSVVNAYTQIESFAHVPILGNLASLTASTNLTVTSPQSGNDTSASESTQTNTETKPEPRIILDADKPLSGTVSLAVIVPDATEVKLALVRTRDRHLIFLGQATHVDSTTWKYSWATERHDDGEYKIKAVIKNSFGSYDFNNAEIYTLENSVVKDDTTNEDADESQTDRDTSTEVASSTESNESATSTPDVDQSSPVRVEFNKDRSRKNISVFTISALLATEIKVYARNTETYTLYYVGLAKHFDNDTWYVSWKTDALPSGTYTIRAKATINDISYDSTPITYEVQNGTIKNSEGLSGTSTERTTTPSSSDIDVHFSDHSPLKGEVAITILSQHMDSIELYALPQGSLTPHFLGAARRDASGTWKFVWETTQTPNGSYEVYARGTSPYGSIDGEQQTVRILNEITPHFTEEEEKKLDSLIEVEQTLNRKVEDSDFIVQESTTTDEDSERETYVQPVDSFLKEIEVTASSREEVEKILAEFRVLLQQKLDALSRAERLGNTEAYQITLSEIQTLKEESIAKIPKDIDDSEVVLKIEGYVYQIISVLQELTLTNERILKERIGDAVSLDSDKDEISDYDETHLYKTNPFVADTDGDSFIDGIEVQGGYDPHNSDTEALVIYESPKESGIVREDILVIDSITTLTETETSDPAPRGTTALISGKSLPHSFVTLYIYSTPVIVTVRTDAEGNWSYLFDKELEEGNHEIYVGITDNAGRIVAKSNPLPFVKTAEAFTSTDPVSVAVEASEVEPSLIGDNILLLIGSLVVVVFGFILLLLGVHVTRRTEPVTPSLNTPIAS